MTVRRELATRMRDAALRLLDGLDEAQRARARFPFPSTAERESWFYTPTDHGGLPLAAMTSAQHRLTHRLLATGLSAAGYVTVATIMGLENVLDHTEGWRSGFGRERGRDPLLYWIAVFGSPADDTWSWRFGGHHVSLHHTILDGEVVATTPCFLGADPAASPLLGPHLQRPLAGVEDLARELMRSLTVEERRLAIVSDVPPVDLVGVNRSRLQDGDTTLPLPLIWRGRLEAALDAAMDATYRAATEQIGLTEEHLAAVAFSSTPKGISGARLGTEQHDLLRALLDVYLGRVPDELAAAEASKFAGDAIKSLSFLWAGGIEPGEPHYYRVQGTELLVEYDNTQRDVNHVHSVWRDLRHDFGRDVLADHYASDH